jgi:hypothetical protein
MPPIEISINDPIIHIAGVLLALLKLHNIKLLKNNNKIKFNNKCNITY